MDTQLNLFPDDDILRKARPRLIGFAGQAGSGKSVCANVLMDRGYKRVKFADGLKEMLRALFRSTGIEDFEIERRMEGDLKETPDDVLLDQTPRWAMQSLGQEWGRELIHPNLWVTIWEKAARSAMDDGFDVVVDDVRYVNEVNAIRNLGGAVHIVTRPASMLVRRDHPSELFDFKSDGVIVNALSLEELQDQARSLTF